VALSHVWPLSHVLPYFSTLIPSSPHLVIFRHPYLPHTKSNLEFFSAIDSAIHFLHICRLDFHLKEQILPSNFEKIIWSN
jgi:hypothetical protein